jgi:alkyl hydroperoxide reductase subunit F
VYCSTCDAPLFRNKDVVVTGSGNAAMEGVIDVVTYANQVTLLIRGDHIKSDPVSRDKVLELEKQGRVTVIFQGEITEIVGDKLVSGVKYLDKTTNQTKELAVQGVFVEIGSIPNSDFLRGLVEMDDFGRVIIDHRTGETSEPGIYAAGAVTDQMYDQNNISVGDAIKATLSAYTYLVHFK